MSYPQLLTAEKKLVDAKKLLSLPHIVVICGSTRFMTEMNEADTGPLGGRVVLDVHPVDELGLAGEVDVVRSGAAHAATSGAPYSR
ncbi:hypothetical protein ACH5A3_44285 [Streptomyces echinatus]|uniref:hypothetical protein n=1 Tax=Streptomyces echinatus TaxID=67293 RepID=UPI0037907148